MKHAIALLYSFYGVMLLMQSNFMLVGHVTNATNFLCYEAILLMLQLILYYGLMLLMQPIF